MLEACLDLESRPDLVAAARAFVRTAMTEWELHRLVDDAVLVCSELVANAVLHARTGIRLTVSSDGFGRARIEVYDENTRMPSQAACPDDATSGRGLNLVASLVHAWGTEHRGDGKVVWAEVGVPAIPDDDDCLDVTAVNTVDEALHQIEAQRTRTEGTDRPSSV